jgi:hypothetical protein
MAMANQPRDRRPPSAPSVASVAMCSTSSSLGAALTDVGSWLGRITRCKSCLIVTGKLMTRLTVDPAPSYRQISALLDMPIGSIGHPGGKW